MRTKNLMMAMAAFAMAGCSQNEVTDVNPDTHPTVGFDVYTGVPTRGAETTTATLKDNTKGNFGILAFYTGASNWETAKTTTQPNFMYNERCIMMQALPVGLMTISSTGPATPTT